MLNEILKDPSKDHRWFSMQAVKFTNGENAVINVARVGNSLTWHYTYDSDGNCHFININKWGRAFEGTGGVSDLAPGDFIWFNSNGKDTRWGRMIPPKSEFLKTLWQNKYYFGKNVVSFNVDKKCMKAMSSNILNDFENEIDECVSLFVMYLIDEPILIATVDRLFGKILKIHVAKGYDSQFIAAKFCEEFANIKNEGLYDLDLNSFILIEMEEDTNN